MACRGDIDLLVGKGISLEVLYDRIEGMKLRKRFMDFLEMYPCILESTPYIPEHAKKECERLLVDMEPYLRHLKGASDLLKMALENVVTSTYQV